MIPLRRLRPGQLREATRSAAVHKTLDGERDPQLKIGVLPLDVSLRLKRAATVSEPGSLERQSAINAVYAWSNATYPAYFR